VERPDDLIERVAAAVREVSESAIEPRFTALNDGDVEEKSVGEVVTAADREAEILLTAHLEAILPGVPVVGEEGCAADPARLAALDAERVWLVDPLDGTANFVAGSPDWAVMVALVAGGTAVASWIWQPVTGRMYLAERGGGAYCNGSVLRAEPRPAEEGRLRGVILSRFLDPATAATVALNSGRFAKVTGGRRCSGVEYPALVEGLEDFVLFWRTLPWDHAPGVLLVEEAGGTGRRPGGSPYRPGFAGIGLLVAADARTWNVARQLLG
jgi:fructose-1,6-bisphosphatase/inositol monophosphatase family enzyme